MISVRLRDAIIKIKHNTTLSQLLMKEGVSQQYHAVALNRQFIAAQNYSSTLLQENDRIDIIIPMQGG